MIVFKMQLGAWYIYDVLTRNKLVSTQPVPCLIRTDRPCTCSTNNFYRACFHLIIFCLFHTPHLTELYPVSR